MNKLKVAIIGTGNIGTDLLIKLLRTKHVQVVSFVGRRWDSNGINLAKNLNVEISIDGIQYFVNHQNCCDLVYDCTSALDAIQNYKVFKKQGIKVIDLTPSKIGEMCVPDINSCAIKEFDNVNMITCGGQASLPILNLVKKFCKGISYIEVVSQIASKSAGMATRINIDSYIKTTQSAITKFIKCGNNKVILNLNPAIPQVDMQTTMFIQAYDYNISLFEEALIKKIIALKQYIPNYELIISPTLNENGILILSIKVRGVGDYLSPYAGNLDIINCASIKVTQELI